MAGKKTTTKAVANVADDKTLAKAAGAYQQEGKGLVIQFPRICLAAQDDDEKDLEAGDFYIEQQSEEVDPKTGKKLFERTKIKDGAEVIIYFKRHQLKYFDGKDFTNSPIYDLPDEVLPLWCKGTEVHRGTPQELRAEYKYTDPTTKKERTLLEDNRIIYVIYKDELYQINLRGSSMFALLKYERGLNPTTVVTKLSSEPMKKGKNEWNQMTFTNVRKLTTPEAELVLEKQDELIKKIAEQKAGFDEAEKPEGDDF